MYEINYAKELNEAQYQAATTLEGPVLVIAGAGSGKTRTVVYRLAYMVESGIPTSQILLLTFTRKASQEMLRRAERLLGYGVGGVHGGTFHAMAYSILRQYRPKGYERNVSLMDSGDITAAMQQCRDMLHIGKADRSFPRNQTIVGLFSKARNKESTVEDILRREAYHLLPHAESLQLLSEAYTAYKKEHALLDYDDLLFDLETALRQESGMLAQLQGMFRYIMVDEYQDTNRVQARLVRLLAGERGNVMAVGDDAQSIYAFRGADIRNILDFPHHFANTRIIKLEENYRSLQPILDLTNSILSDAPEAYRKTLYTKSQGGTLPELVRPLNNRTQSELVVRKISELARDCPLREIAILFRAAYQSYDVEMALRQAGIRFRKYGGLKFSDAAHVKDVMSFVRLVHNPLDFPSFRRIMELSKGIGPKTSQKIYEAMTTGNETALKKACARHSDALNNIHFIRELRENRPAPYALFKDILAHYQPFLEQNYPDDFPYREQGLEELAQLAGDYAELDLFISDFCLEEPDPAQEEDEDAITLSTVHSAKGLEWDAVLIIDLVEDRFPSRHACLRADEFEEERRLLYVACTRARNYLGLFAPSAVYSRETHGEERATPSPFIRALSSSLYEELQECPGGRLARRGKQERTARQNLRRALTSPYGASHGPNDNLDESPVPEGSSQEHAESLPSCTAFPEPVEEKYHESQEPPVDTGCLSGTGKTDPSQCGFCRHRIFGRGKIVEYISPDKCRVHFPNIGLKVILTNYLVLEES